MTKNKSRIIFISLLIVLLFSIQATSAIDNDMTNDHLNSISSIELGTNVDDLHANVNNDDISNDIITIKKTSQSTLLKLYLLIDKHPHLFSSLYLTQLGHHLLK